MRSLTLIVLLLLASATLVVAQSTFEDSSPLQNNPSKVQLFPNPATDVLYVRVEGVEVANLSIIVRNIIGNNLPVEVEFIGTNEFRIRVKEFSTGYYLLAMRDEASNFKGTYKFIKR